MIAGSTGRVKSRRFRTVRVVVSSLSTVARSIGRSPLHRSQASAGLSVDTAQGVWQHSTRTREGTQLPGGACNTLHILHQASIIRLPMYADDDYHGSMTCDRLRLRDSNFSRSVSPDSRNLKNDFPWKRHACLIPSNTK